VIRGKSISAANNQYLAFLYSTLYSEADYGHSGCIRRILIMNLARAIPRLVFGLKWKRLRQWREVLQEEGRSMTLKSWWHMAGQAFQALLSPVPRDLYLHRLYTCRRCPLYDSGLRRCRPYTGSPNGCGCFVPYKAIAPEPCWLRQRFPDQGWD
jgi:hypothetical protein